MKNKNQETMSEDWFIEGISPWDTTSTKVCLYLTNYKLLPHKEIEKNYKKEISKLRWITIENAKIVMGSTAKGLVVIEGKTFIVTYAWGGLNSKESYHIRESYTVAIKGKNCGRYFTNLGKRINKFEGNPQPEFASILNLIFMDRIKPYKSILR
ncbi:MAG TPA: hypothetical protein ENH82_09550 [bacterium]|nr:hypothetical protein [bacterium]